ncbi:MAG: sigma-54-dependent Fis family transcriptional regulator [Myxococcales bacterium]|nr:sigma-54-dependent Fis family transcriptional regulator [Myxococcales bacterium]
MNDQRVLVVDDFPEIVVRLERLLLAQGYRVETAATGREALRKLDDGFQGVVLLDLGLPDFEGLDLLDQMVRSRDSEAIQVIILTGFNDTQNAAEAVKHGAFDYIPKTPGMDDRVFVSVQRAFESIVLKKKVRNLTDELESRRMFSDIVAQSDPMLDVFEQLKNVVQSRVTVLIHGESGTGKELVARAIHNHGPRSRKPFVAINCAAIPEQLLESELFGHEKGAFTSAVSRKVGLFEQADGGTVFLDEIGEMNQALQAKILRFLQEREFQRVGGTDVMRVDVRILSATHRDLSEEVAAGRFRQDLYYRLAVFQVTLPPLRERRGDTRLLVQHFLNNFAREEQREVPAMSEQALRVLENYSFPGNVRELQNIVSHAAIVCTGDAITVKDLPKSVVDTVQRAPTPRAAPADFIRALDQTIVHPEDIPPIELVEAELIRRAIELHDGNITLAGERLGLSRATVYRRVEKLGIKKG